MKNSVSSPEGTLQEEFGARWEIGVKPAGLPVWTALHKSADGRHERYLVAPGPGALLERLRVVDAEEDE